MVSLTEAPIVAKAIYAGHAQAQRRRGLRKGAKNAKAGGFNH